MTSKELLYVEDALGHENFMKKCACETSKKLQDQTLATFVKELEQKTHRTSKQISKFI